MKHSEISNMSMTELKKKRAGLADDLFQAKIKNSIGQLSNPLEIRKLRRDIAKINTVITTKTKQV